MSREVHIPLKYVLAGAVVLALVLFLLLHLGVRRQRTLAIEQTETLVDQVRRIGELSSAGYYEELVLTDRDESYLAEVKRATGLNRLTGNDDFVIICKGRVRAGYDFTKMGPDDFSVSGDTLRLTLPPVEILDVVINPTDYELFAGHRTHEETVGLVLQAKQRLRADAIRAGILDQAELSAESALRRLLASMGYREVVLTFRKGHTLRPAESPGR
ncbi:MAG: DUF4230 domain-containing protein [Bacteroidales bacterium]|jgi:hypothetical protein|nr:DUF4230 domain-containing protein [Bacteroidales bacterium]MDO5000477.1 DUF4230 domain-containing protein [Bacteroidales bacterium]